MVRMSLYPLAAAMNASPIPVLPLVGSTSVVLPASQAWLWASGVCPQLDSSPDREKALARVQGATPQKLNKTVRTWCDQPFLLCILNHVLSDAVFNASAWLLYFQFCSHTSSHSLGDLVQKDHRRVADEVCHVICNLGPQRRSRYGLWGNGGCRLRGFEVLALLLRPRRSRPCWGLSMLQALNSRYQAHCSDEFSNAAPRDTHINTGIRPT